MANIKHCYGRLSIAENAERAWMGNKDVVQQRDAENNDKQSHALTIVKSMEAVNAKPLL